MGEGNKQTLGGTGASVSHSVISESSAGNLNFKKILKKSLLSLAMRDPMHPI